MTFLFIHVEYTYNYQPFTGRQQLRPLNRFAIALVISVHRNTMVIINFDWSIDPPDIVLRTENLRYLQSRCNTSHKTPWNDICWPSPHFSAKLWKKVACVGLWWWHWPSYPDPPNQPPFYFSLSSSSVLWITSFSLERTNERDELEACVMLQWLFSHTRVPLQYVRATLTLAFSDPTYLWCFPVQQLV